MAWRSTERPHGDAMMPALIAGTGLGVLPEFISRLSAVRPTAVILSSAVQIRQRQAEQVVERELLLDLRSGWGL
jgi:hypothetical protein